MTRYTANIITKSPATPTGPTTTGRAPGIWRMDDVAYWTRQGLWPNSNLIPDQYFPYVSLLLSTTALGNANNNLFVDSSGAFNPVSRNGNITQGSFSPYSTNWSNYFDGSGDYFTVPYTTANFDWYTAGVDFTIEYWFFANSLTGTSYVDGGVTKSTVIGNRSATNTTDYWSFGPNAGGTVTFYYYNGGPVAVNSTSTITANSWNHIAMTKTSSGITIFVNGVAQTTTAISGTPQSSASFPITVGQGNNTSYNGYVSNLRIVRGTAIYSGNFTPPTAPLTAVTNTKLLTCQSNRFRDASTNNLTLTVTGNTSVQDFGPFSPAYPGAVYNQSDITNWSGYFDGSGDWLTVPNNTALQFGSGDFTVEFWANVSTSSGFRGMIGKGGPATGWAVFIDNNNYWAFSIDNLNYAGSVTPIYGTWTHIAFTRSGTTFTLYINGTSVRTHTSSSSFTQTEQLVIGAGRDLTIPYTGYISNLRLVKGAVVYTSNFTPPTTNLTAISGTSLLTLQNAAFTDNSTNNFVITQNGNPTVTGNSPFNTVGYWSVLFNGSNNWLAASANTATTLGTGNFTIEGWFFTSYNSANQVIIEQAVIDEGTGNNSGWLLYLNTSGNVVFGGAGGQTYINAAPSTSFLGRWTHFALVRTSTTSITLYINGTSIGSTSTNVNMSAALDVRADTPTLMGSHELQLAGSFFNGYLSNIRIVKGTAVYTSNFTPPTSPLTAISGTGLLTLQSSRLVDNSGNNITVASTFSSYSGGSPSVQSFDPFYTATIASNGGSIFADGTGDYLTIPSSPTIAPGSSAFTWECWFYPNSFIGNTGDGDTLWITSGSGGLQIGCDANTANWGVARNGIAWVLLTSTFPTNKMWNHIAIVRSGTGANQAAIFLNGTRVVQGTLSSSFPAGSTNVLSANGGAGNSIDGYVSNMRLVVGTAIYDPSLSTCTVPTAPANPTPATTLIVNGMNAGIYDATTINDMETVGNAQVSTVQSKFGGSSVYFDGSGDAVYASSNPALALGSGNFTVECWFYANATMNYGTMWTTDDGTNSASGIRLVTGPNNNFLTVGVGGSAVLTASSAYSNSTWNHAALVRNGSTITLYLNGTSVGSFSNSTNFSLQTFLLGRYGAAYYWNGYIDDLRVTSGIARYTANFTPPDKAFPTY